MIDNLMFSYVSFKIISDKKVYDLKLNFMTMGLIGLVVIFMLGMTSYSLIIRPFMESRFTFMESRHKTQIQLMNEYESTMVEKKILLNKSKIRMMNVFEESEIDENISKILDKCRGAYCIMQMVNKTLPGSRATAIASVPIGVPTVGYFSSGFGYRTDPFTGRWQMHWGIDLTNKIGTPIKTTMTGTVVNAGYSYIYGGYGIAVVVDNGYYKTLYAHLLYAKVRYDQKVKKGDIVGYMGNTGYSTGVHLHYGVIVDNEYIDSLEFIK